MGVQGEADHEQRQRDEYHRPGAHEHARSQHGGAWMFKVKALKL